MSPITGELPRTPRTPHMGTQRLDERSDGHGKPAGERPPRGRGMRRFATTENIDNDFHHGDTGARRTTRIGGRSPPRRSSSSVSPCLGGESLRLSLPAYAPARRARFVSPLTSAA